VVRAVIFGTFILACGLLVAGIGLVLRTGPGAKPVIAGTEPGQIAPALGGFPIPPGGMPSGTTLPQAPTTAQPRPAQPARAVAVPEAAPVPQQRPAARAIDMQAALRQAPSPTVRTRPLATPRPVQYPAPQPLPDTPRRVPPPIALRQAPAPAPQPVQPSSVPTQQAARAYYFQRDYPKAIDAYESLLSANRDSRASVREELAWCYYQMSRPDDSIAQYRSALAAYEKELAAPETRDEAEHGIRTCQAALEALGAR
jgi:hypothetical protein